MATAGQIEYTITVDTSGLKKGLNEAEKETKTFSQRIGESAKQGAKAFGKTLVAGLTTSAIAVGKLGKDAISTYADFEQLSDGIVSMFGGMEKGYEQIEAVNTLAKNAWQDLTLSQNDYYTTFSSTYPLMKADIADQNKAIEETNRLMRLESDLANTFGYSMENASNAINWALKGSFNYLDNLNIGIKGTQEGFLEASRKAGYFVNSVKELTSDQILDIIEKTASEYGVLGKTAEEASNTIQGSAKMMKASWTNLMTGLADENANFDDLLADFIKSVGVFGKKILPTIKTTLKGIVNLIKEIVPEIIAMLPELIADLLPTLVETTKLLLLAIVENLPMLMRVFIDNLPVIIDGIVQIIMALIPHLPEILWLLVEAIFKAIVSLIESIGKNIGKVFADMFNNSVRPFFENMFSSFGDFAEGASRAISDFANGVKVGVENIGKWFHDVFQGIWDFVVSVFQNIGGFFKGVWDTIASIFTGIGTAIGEAVSGAFKAVVNGILAFIEGFVNAPIHILNTFIDAINWAFGFVGVNLGKIQTIQLPRMATGGIVPSQNGGRLIVAGEGGQDEWVVPESKMADMVQKLNERSGMGNITINIQGVFATSDAEQRAVAEQIYDKLQEINKSRMGAYL